MQQPLITVFGEVLFDRFPDGQQILGGAPFNVAWHLQAFQQAPLFISRIGQDQAGTAIQAAMQRWGMLTTGMQTDLHHPSGAVTVSLNAGEPSYAILAQQAYDYIQASQLPSSRPNILYHGSLALRHTTSRQALQRLQQRLPDIVFMDINLRAPWWELDSLNNWLRQADWVKLNAAELQLILPGDDMLTTKMQQLLSAYRLQGLVVTLGSAGAVALSKQDGWMTVSPAANLKVVDTVGAGDAFSAVLLMGLQQQWPLAQTMRRAQQFAGELVGRQGATIEDLGFYQGIMAGWK